MIIVIILFGYLIKFIILLSKPKLGEVINKNFDHIIVSPGININNCKLRNVLKKNLKKIYTDLDIFFSQYSNNTNITITGTNGKSTTAKIIYEVLRQKKNDVRLVGNIGNPILLEKNNEQINLDAILAKEILANLP